ncbi:MAG TPA: hypothetical protein VF060_35345 [Trebonia sp.]
MARVKDLWFSEVPAKDANGKTVRDPDGRVVTERRKTAKHPDRGGNKNAKRWLARWIDPDGKEATKAFARQSEGKTYADRMEADGQRGEYIDPDAGREKFGDLARKVMRLRDVGPSSRERYESVYRNHVETVSGKRPVKGVRASDIVEWLRGPISKMSGSIQEAAYNIVAFTFDVAVEDKLRRDNPARSKIVPVPRAEYSPREPWTPERYWQVRDEHPAAYRALTDCEAGMGLRRGEASGWPRTTSPMTGRPASGARSPGWAASGCSSCGGAASG